MDNQERAEIEAVERAIGGGEFSTQPRFDQNEMDVDSIWTSTIRWVDNAENAPEYKLNSRTRDAWLSEYWHTEPHLAGVIHSMCSIDSNRGWTLIGGRNQVLRYSKVLHNWQIAPGQIGWRNGVFSNALSFYTTDLGGIVEVGRDNNDAVKDVGPMRGMVHTDPTKCILTAKNDYPLKYYPSNGKMQPWHPSRYMRIVSMPNIDERLASLGYCFVSRALALAQIMVAIYRHDMEELGERAPRGLLLLSGISQSQWKKAMQNREIKMDSKGLQYYGALAVLATSGINVSSADAKLIALSNLPQGFNMQEWVSMLMYGYALCAGYDPSEFYPVQFGSLGRGTEMEVQHQKATQKGSLNYANGLADQLMRPDMLPATIDFQFDERDDEGERMAAEVQEAWANVMKTIDETGVATGAGGNFSLAQKMEWWADKGIIPKRWVEEAGIPDTDEQASDDELMERDMLMTRERVVRAAQKYPNEPIVSYHWKSGKFRTICESGTELIRRVFYPSAKLHIKRQVDDTSDILFEDDGVKITNHDVDLAISASKRRTPEFSELLEPPIYEE